MSLTTFFAGLPFRPDAFQKVAAEAIESGASVVVTAPTGSGKTLVAEAAVHLALARGRRAFYTTPIKALSNQKFADFRTAYGEDQVGLLTGDNSINGTAPIVVMTTEVLRNMIYSDSQTLDDLDTVILDEVHYLQDRFRGAVWEEVIIHAPPHIQLVCLSATVSNADEFTDWVRARRGPTTLVLEETRPVPLESLYAIKDRFSDTGLIVEPMLALRKGRREPNPDIVRILARKRSQRRYTTPRRGEIVAHLAAREMLPAIYFIFSRAGCEDAAERLIEAGISLTTPDERLAIGQYAEARTAHLAEQDLAVLGYGRWISLLQAGVAAHHAGLVPAFKETVEELFLRGLIRVVFATETLSLGINMPAKTVVLENLSRFTGETHEVLRPGDYTQLTGRAGRRGIDTQGYGVVLYSRFIEFDRVAGIASAGSHALRSSFRPTYNMATNLVANYPQVQAERLLNASYGQYQRRKSLGSLRKTLETKEKRLAELEHAANCDLGEVAEYIRLLRTADGAGLKKAAAAFIRSLQPGQVIEIPGGKRSGRYVVVKQWRGADPPRIVVLSEKGTVAQFRSGDLSSGTARLGSLSLAKPYQPREPRFQQTVASALRNFQSSRIDRMQPEGTDGAADHPVAVCPDRSAHVKAAGLTERAGREVDRLRHQIALEGEGLVAEFHAILDLLTEWGYVEGWTLAAGGERLRFIYNERDLLLADTISIGVFAGLDAAETAALASCFVYEPRVEQTDGRLPTARLAERWESIVARSDALHVAERKRRLPETREPHSGFAVLAFDWARGGDLESLLGDDDLAAGDFVRTCRQLLDLLRQLRDAEPALREQVSDAIRMLDRGVVAAGGLT
ncbi:MAG: DEAD/DEAH box helicase [Acidimicrobiia bacterium]|nr:DEAD/DEAH box helicase [Acidimicrobiia bacterium]MDH3396800.1 DEAD/DEAH box helicase [Acidimicrobiia bacterium]